MKDKCPNCDIELDITYQSEWDEKGCLYVPYKMCGICSYGWPIDWKSD